VEQAVSFGYAALANRDYIRRPANIRW